MSQVPRTSAARISLKKRHLHDFQPLLISGLPHHIRLSSQESARRGQGGYHRCKKMALLEGQTLPMQGPFQLFSLFLDRRDFHVLQPLRE